MAVGGSRLIFTALFLHAYVCTHMTSPFMDHTFDSQHPGYIVVRSCHANIKLRQLPYTRILISSFLRYTRNVLVDICIHGYVYVNREKRKITTWIVINIRYARCVKDTLAQWILPRLSRIQSNPMDFSSTIFTFVNERSFNLQNNLIV